MGKILNEYFSPVFTIKKDTKTGEFGTVNESVLRIVIIMVKEVLNVLRHMKVDQSPRPNQILEDNVGS